MKGEAYETATFNPVTVAHQQLIANEMMEQHRHIKAHSRASGFFTKALKKF
jgi:hypothetical protein